jgi:hypothetical protein
MVAVPIIEGVYVDTKGRFRVALPVNYCPVVQAQGISSGYMRPAEGLVATGEGAAPCRGAIVWNGAVYAVMGPRLCRITEAGDVEVIGTIGGSGRVQMTYSFTHLAIASGDQLWLYDGMALARNVDADLGAVKSLVWVDGYFMTTDGTSLVVTELGDPFSVNPLKYGSSEIDPDPVVGLVKVRGEVYAVNRNTIEVFQNVGGALFPFQRVNGGQIMRGALSAQLAVTFEETVAFVGGGRNEPPSIWMAANGTANRIASREVETLLQGYDLTGAWLDTRTDAGASYLHLHLPDQTLVFDAQASAATNSLVWFSLKSNTGHWRAAAMVWAYGKRMVFDTDTGAFGEMSGEVSSHWGQRVNWELTTPIIFNNTNGGAVDALELTGTPGHVAMGDAPQIMMQWSEDGATWSIAHTINIGRNGDRNKRMAWFRCGPIRNWRLQRFRGTSDGHVSIARLEATIRPSQW